MVFKFNKHKSILKAGALDKNIIFYLLSQQLQVELFVNERNLQLHSSEKIQNLILGLFTTIFRFWNAFVKRD